MRPPILIFSPLLGTPENAGVTTHLWAPEKAGVRRPILIFSPHLALGTPRMQGSSSNSALFWAPEKARMRQPILIFSPYFGDPRDCRGDHPLVGPREGRGEAANSDFAPALGVGGGDVAIPPSLGPPSRQG